MKKTALYLSFLLVTFNLSAQSLTPEFEFQLFIEDAAGNKDTLTLGYDDLATDGIDPEFDEENILNIPWQDGLDFRIGDKIYFKPFEPVEWLSENSYLTKRQILASYVNELNKGQSEEVTIQFKVQNLPIVVNWDRFLFTDNKRNNSQIYTYDARYPGANMEIPLRGVLNGLSIKREPSKNNDLYFYASQAFINDYKIIEYVEESDTIGILKFVFFGLGTSSLMEMNSSAIKIYPNPFIDNLTIELEKQGQDNNFIIYQLDGKEVYNEIHNSKINTVQLTDLPKGIYILKILNDSAIIEIRKIVKL